LPAKVPSFWCQGTSEYDSVTTATGGFGRAGQNLGRSWADAATTKLPKVKAAIKPAMVRRLMFPCLLPASVCAQYSSAFGWESNCLHLPRVGRAFALRAFGNLMWWEIEIRVRQRRAHAVAPPDRGFRKADQTKLRQAVARVALDGDQRRIEVGETAGEDDGERHVGYYWRRTAMPRAASLLKRESGTSRPSRSEPWQFT
jgi:hypothetical protein